MEIFYIQKFMHAMHLVGMVAWLAGLLYLVRLYVYHEECEAVISGGNASSKSEAETKISGYRTMERRLLRVITTPAMVITIVAGLTSAWLGNYFVQGWLHTKILLVLLLLGYHHHIGANFKKLQKGSSGRSPKYFRIINEIATFLLILIVSLAVFRSLFPALISSVAISGVLLIVFALNSLLRRTK